MSSILATTPLNSVLQGNSPAAPLMNLSSEQDVHDRFERDGWVILRHVDSVSAAADGLRQIVSQLRSHQWVFSAQHRTVFSRAERIPQCPGMEDATFQALHFDYGAPVLHVPGSSQYTCLFTAIYFPFGEREGEAETRLLNLSPFLQEACPDLLRAMSSGLANYARLHGDGWEHPSPFRTGRLACFARFLDAASDAPQLGHFFNQGTWEWFRAGASSATGADELAREADWFTSWGLSLERHEQRVCLQPGELLVIDNLRTCHGRLGSRRMSEVYQMMAGVWDTSETDCRDYGRFLDSLIS
jgi:hypothetical protein